MDGFWHGGFFNLGAGKRTCGAGGGDGVEGYKEVYEPDAETIGGIDW